MKPSNTPVTLRLKGTPVGWVLQFKLTNPTWFQKLKMRMGLIHEWRTPHIIYNPPLLKKPDTHPSHYWYPLMCKSSPEYYLDLWKENFPTRESLLHFKEKSDHRYNLDLEDYYVSHESYIY